MATSTSNPLIMKLQNLCRLGEREEDALSELTRNLRTVPAGTDLKAHGERPKQVHVVMEGLACRYKVLPDGRRQIMAFLVPGDPCDFQVFLLEQMDHGVATLTSSIVSTIPQSQIERIAESDALLTKAFWYSTLLDEAILREWLVNVGRRDAYERVAHLLWELFLRHAIVGRINGMTFSLPLTQRELADALGLSTVHINRTMQRLKSENVIETDGRMLVILQPARLRQISGFDPDYLHFGDSMRLGTVANL